MRTGAIKAMMTDAGLHKRLAKYLALRCFRNSVLEDLHGGIVPVTKSGDYKDVVVRNP
jgi:hypothetical protein